jgi:hypothetical protein
VISGGKPRRTAAEGLALELQIRPVDLAEGDRQSPLFADVMFVVSSMVCREGAI